MPPVAAVAAPIIGIAAGAAAVASTVATIVAPKSGVAKILGQVSKGFGIAGAVSSVLGPVLGLPPIIQFPGLEPGQVPSLQTELGDLTPLLVAISTIADIAGKGASVLQEDVGERLFQLVGTHGGILDTIVKNFFPEFAGVKNNLGGLLSSVLDGIIPEASKLRGILEFIGLEQFPAAGLGIAQSNRSQGVSERTLSILKARRMIPREFTTNPNGDELGLTEEELGELTEEELEGLRRARAGLPQPPPAIVGLEGVSGEVGATETLAMVTGEGLQGVESKIGGFGGVLVNAALTVLEPFLLTGLEVGGRFVETVADAGRRTFGNIGQEMIESVKDTIQSAGVTLPGEQGAVTSRVLGTAFTLGVGAHFVAAGAEFLMPLKHLGLPQVAALMVDLAGFGIVARAELGAQVKAGIQVPAEFEANAIFRSQLPQPFVAEIQFQKRDLSESDFRQILRWHGFTEGMIDIIQKGAFTEPRLFDIQRVVDDSFEDVPWLTEKVTRAGYSDSDIPKVVEALTRNALRGIRIGYQKELQTAFARGIIDAAELEGEIERLGLGPQGRQFTLLVSELQRRRELAEDWERVVRGQAEDQIVSIDDYRIFLEGLGFESSRVAVLVATVQAKVERKVTRDERADIKKAMRDFQRTQIKIAQESFKRRQITQSELSAFLVQFGIEEVQAAAMAILAGIRREPVPRVPPPVSAEVQRERENKIIRDTALVAFRKDQISEQVARSILLSIDIPEREAEALLTREVARKTPPPTTIKKEPPEVVKARQLRTQALITEFREEKINAEELRSGLVEIGNPEEVAQAFVEREEARVPLPAPPEPPPPVEETSEEREARQLRTTAAREVFRAGRLTPEELFSLLVNLGNDPDVAAAMVELEVVRKTRRLPT